MLHTGRILLCLYPNEWVMYIITWLISNVPKYFPHRNAYCPNYLYMGWKGPNHLYMGGRGTHHLYMSGKGTDHLYMSGRGLDNLDMDGKDQTTYIWVWRAHTTCIWMGRTQTTCIRVRRAHTTGIWVGRAKYGVPGDIQSNTHYVLISQLKSFQSWYKLASGMGSIQISGRLYCQTQASNFHCIPGTYWPT